MNKLVVVTSSIQVRPGRFTYSDTRSIFNTEERFRQTIFTINSIQTSLPDAKIVVLDSSDEYKEYRDTLGYFGNVEFLPLKEMSPQAFELANVHPIKSYCEAIMLQTFYHNYRQEIKKYDYIVKASGRYFFYYLNNSLFIPENKDKIFYKFPLNYEWDDSWNYHFVDRRKEQNNTRLHQYCTILYAYGIENLDRFVDFNDAILHLLNRPNMSHYDVETLSYYFTRPFESNVIETNWKVCGWDGVSGTLMLF